MSESSPQSAPSAPQPHEDFFAAQVRNRRATWRISLLCALAIALAGIPLTLIITPLLYAMFMAGAAILNFFHPLSPAFWQHSSDLARIASTAGDFVFNHQHATLHVLMIAALAFLGPGIALAVLVWAGVYAILQRGGVGGALIALGVREPNRADQRELQLDDVVHEMALAARMNPLPRLLIIDDAGANAAAIGTSAADAHVLVARGLIASLTREEMQGAIAHLIASIGNGDLRIGFRIVSVFESLGMLVTMLNAPFGPHARATLGKIVRFALRRDRSNEGAEAEAIATLLANSTGTDTNDIERFFDSNRPRGLARKVLNVLLFPIFSTNAAIQLTLWFLSEAMLAPAFALLWRTRKYLADATAVQLLRNPDALAAALVRMDEAGGEIGVASGAPFLFVLSPGSGHRTTPSPRADQIEAAARAWASLSGERLPEPIDLAQVRSQATALRVAAMRGDPEARARLAMFARAMAVARIDTARSEPTGPEAKASGPLAETMLSFHPPLKRRLARLVRMGARADFMPKATSHTVEIIAGIVLTPLIILLVGMFVFLIAMMIMLNLMFLSLWFGLIHIIFSLVAGA